MMGPGLVIHIAAGTIGILTGAVALSVAKGERLHRSFGTVFFVAMLIMAGMGAALAIFIPQRGVVVGGIFTGYFIATAWMTVRRPAGTIGAFEYWALLVALGCAAADFTLGLEARASPTGRLDGYPAAFFFTFAGFAVWVAFLDLKVIRQGGISGAPRLARHLWRMCFALFFASASFFLGQRKAMPDFMRGSPLLYVPEIAVLGAMIFWLVRVRMARRLKPAAVAP